MQEGLGASFSSMEPLARKDVLPVDEHFVREGSRMEALQGRVLVTPPAEEPHGQCHAKLAYLLEAHVTSEYRVAVDMLTRTGRTSDFAPDASVYPAARHPETGGRRLEELAFEIVAEQWIGIPSEKARELSRRGVRRIFAIVLKSSRVMEWSQETDGFAVVANQSSIQEGCFVRPLPVKALLDATAADTAVIQALSARGALAQIEHDARVEGRREGRAEGLRTAIEALAGILEIPLSAARRERLAGADELSLEAILGSLRRERRWPED